jgi:hypothetical protein
MAYGPALFWHSIPEDSKDYVQILGIEANRIVEANELFKLFLVGDNAVPSPSGVMIRSNSISVVCGWEELFRGMYDDQVLFSKLLLSGSSVYVSDQCLYRYRQHGDSLCGTALKSNCNNEARSIYLEWLNEYLKGSSRNSLPVRVLMAEQLWYIRCHNENLNLSKARFSRKIKIVISMGALLMRQKNIILSISLLWRIFSQQIKRALCSIKHIPRFE